MATPPDQFQRRTFVRLPYTDLYLSDDAKREDLAGLSEAMKRPWLTVKIAGSIVKSTESSPRTGSWSKVDSPTKSSKL